MSESEPAAGGPAAKLEAGFERLLFQARWLMAPIYVGLIVALAALVVVFVRDVVSDLGMLIGMTSQDAILMALSLIDISLVGNLMLIVIYSGYENFVSKIDTGGNEDRPEWMGSTGFGSVKMKLIVSIIAISAISLLKQLIGLSEGKPASPDTLAWMIGIQLTFVVSGLLMVLMDRLTSSKRKG